MKRNFGEYHVNEKTEYKRFVWASQYQPQHEFTRVGSGGNISAQLVDAMGVDLAWPVSRCGNELRYINIKTADYGGWPVDVLDRTGLSPVTDHVVTTKDKLDLIRKHFGLSISHLAKTLLASRPSLHAWLKGEEPTRDANIERINHIYQIAMEWKRRSPYHYAPDRLMRQPLGEGPSMQARLERKHLDDAEIRDGLDKLLQLMQRQRAQMDHAKQRSAETTLSEQEQERTRHQLTTTIYSK